MARLLAASGIWAIMAGAALGQSGGAPVHPPAQERANALREIILLMEEEAAGLRSQIEDMRAELATGQAPAAAAAARDAAELAELRQQLEAARAETRAAGEKAAAAQLQARTTSDAQARTQQELAELRARLARSEAARQDAERMQADLTARLEAAQQELATLRAAEDQRMQNQAALSDAEASLTELPPPSAITQPSAVLTIVRSSKSRGSQGSPKFRNSITSLPGSKSWMVSSPLPGRNTKTSDPPVVSSTSGGFSYHSSSLASPR